jgi:hypothetical protein
VAVTVELRGAGDLLLRSLVAEGWPQLVRALAEHDASLPRFVAREFEAYLDCGDPASGFAWLTCADCVHHRLVLFSCKTRGFCPSCAGCRMADRAAWWVDRVIPWVPTRQFVWTVPWRLRPLLGRRPKLALGVLRIALGRIEAWYRRATGRSAGRSGAVTAMQRFGSALNFNLHFHIVHLDGVFDRRPDGRLGFTAARPDTVDVEVLVVDISRACERWLRRHGGVVDDEDVGPSATEDDVQAQLQLASQASRVALGEEAGARVRRVQVLGGREIPMGPRCAGYEGYTLHANVSFAAGDRKGLERLCRYVLRPPLATGRLERLPEGRVRVGMKRTWSDGTTAIDLSPLELCEKLAALVPPPRANQVVYAGVLAANASWRAEVVPKVPSSTAAEAVARAARRLVKRAAGMPGVPTPERPASWAELLHRVFGVDGWACPECGKAMVLRTVVVGPIVSGRVVRSLLRSRGPPAG